MSDTVHEVTVSPEDIPGANLSKPYEKHTVAALRWWLLCRGIKAPTSWKKKEIVNRLVSLGQYDTQSVTIYILLSQSESG